MKIRECNSRGFMQHSLGFLVAHGSRVDGANMSAARALNTFRIVLRSEIVVGNGGCRTILIALAATDTGIGIGDRIEYEVRYFLALAGHSRESLASVGLFQELQAKFA